MDISQLVYIDSTGYHFADYPTFLTWIKDQYKTIYGQDSYLEADSQDGQFLSILAKAFYDTATFGSATYNSFSPTSAQGIGLSRLVKINGLRRRPATRSTVDLTIIGTAGTLINNGQAKDTNSIIWNLPLSITIPSGGEITVTATCDIEGNINAANNTVNQIYTPTLGWQSVNNDTAAAPGVAVESDGELRIRQSGSTANPSLTVFEGTIGALENLTGVTKVKGYENDTDVTDGNGIPSHTISCVVEGGDITDICQTIQVHKTPGVGTYGTTSEVVFDKKGMPVLIKFFRPNPVAITVDIEIETFTGYTSNYGEMIKQSVADYINAIGIGNDVLISKIYPPAYLPGFPSSTYDITSLEVNGDVLNVDIPFNGLAACDVSDVTVTVI